MAVSQSRTLRVSVCDPVPIIREGLCSAIDSQSDIDVVAAVGSGQEVIGVVEQLHPDVLITDIEPNGVSCDELAKVIHAGGEAPVQALIFTEPRDDQTVMRCLEVGVRGFLTKDADLGQLTQAVRALSRGEAALAPPVARKVLNWFFWREVLPGQYGGSAATGLSLRECEVLRLLAGGMSNDEIACKLCLSEATIRTHTYRLRRKLNLRSRAQLISLALHSGLAAARFPGTPMALADQRVTLPGVGAAVPAPAGPKRQVT